MHVHRQSIHISLYTMYTTVYVYNIYIYCTVVYIGIKSSTMGLVDKSHDKWVGSPVCIQALSGVIFVQEMMTNHWIWMASVAADGAPSSPQGIPLVESKLSHNYETVQDSTRPRTCISALSFLTLRPGLIHGRARERALDPNLTSFRNYEPRKSLQFAHEAFQSNGAHFGTLSHIQLPTDQPSCTFYHLNMVRHGPLVPHYCMSISTLSRFSLQMLGHTLHQLRLRSPFSKQRLRSGLCKPGREQSFQAHNVRSNSLDSD